MKYVILFLLCVGMVSASDLCVDKGFARTVNTWTYDSGFVSVNGSGVDVTGTSKKAYWTSEILIDGVVYRSGNRTYTLDGGMNGAIPKTTLKYDIQRIDFCSNNDIEVPEFGAIAAVVAALGCVGVYLCKR